MEPNDNASMRLSQVKLIMYQYLRYLVCCNLLFKFVSLSPDQQESLELSIRPFLNVI